MGTSVFDDDGHVELDSFETMCAVLREVYEGQLGKWRGSVSGLPTSGGPGYVLELNPDPDQPDRPPGLAAVFGDHLQKLRPFSLGFIVKMTAEEYAAEYPAGD
ncbi:MAG: hypothetical protein WBB07_17670 [Mycobacterium sp.]